LSEVEQTLAEKNQMLAFEPPAFGNGSTLGGVIAAGLSGPRRVAAGAARDFVLGSKMINSRGEWLEFGGQVMKNVAGYDVSRLLCGSLGILGLIVEVSLKVLPRPAAERSIRIASAQAEAIRLTNTLAGKPVPLSASAWRDGVLSLRLSGAASAVDDACEHLVREHDAIDLPDPAQFWLGLQNHTDPFFDFDQTSESLWRLSLPGTAAVVELPGQQLVEWHGGQRWLRTDATADAIRAAADALGGSATLFRSGEPATGVFSPLAQPLLEIHRRLKKEMDPHGIFNPGRMYPGL
jgi:glycolate oxidase FAD binding subunit